MTETPGDHLSEEPQEERGPEGSRDAQSEQDTDRPAGKADDGEYTGVDAEASQAEDSPDLQSGGN